MTTHTHTNVVVFCGCIINIFLHECIDTHSWCKCNKLRGTMFGVKWPFQMFLFQLCTYIAAWVLRVVECQRAGTHIIKQGWECLIRNLHLFLSLSLSLSLCFFLCAREWELHCRVFRASHDYLVLYVVKQLNLSSSVNCMLKQCCSVHRCQIVCQIPLYRGLYGILSL